MMTTKWIDEANCNCERKISRICFDSHKVDDESREKELHEESRKETPTSSASLCGSTNQGARSGLPEIYHGVLGKVTTACNDGTN
jgi:hypothetical protein